MPFIQRFIDHNDISFKGMRDTAISLLPHDRVIQDRLYNELERGTGILDDDDHLNMYLKCFGNMHNAKLDAAFRCLPNIGQTFSQEIHIYDWGCGQGTATICLLDYLRQNSLLTAITNVTLIEPSIAAVRRAKSVINCYSSNIEAVTVNKVFDELTQDDFSSSSAVKLHLFSNILDVDKFDLAQFIHLFQKSFSGENYFICVGPLYRNNKRVDEFVAATDPDTVFATADKDKGQWLKEWTMSLRVFFKDFKNVEDIHDIRKRIEEYHMKDQFFAGYILDAVEEEITSSGMSEEIEPLLNFLSQFDVKASVPMGYKQSCDSKLAVLANIISRGLPTKAPLYLEKVFAEKFGTSAREEIRGTIRYKSSNNISAIAISEALHIIDPRFDVDFYNGDMLESSFEKCFIEKYLKNTDTEYLVQVLEPQRPLSTIVDVPNTRFNKDQRVDFAIEVPGEQADTGFIVEIDGAPFHSNIFQRLNDRRRDRAAMQTGWQTHRIDQLENNRFIKNWEQEHALNQYLGVLKKNSKKELSGSWNKDLQIVLAPLAVARVERILIEAMMSGALDMAAALWNIVVVERDVPCAAIAIEDIKEKYKNICNLAGCDQHLPEIKLTIVSTKEFKNSPLHLGHDVTLDQSSNRQCDVCIDISMLLRDNIDALPLNVETEVVYIIRSSHYKKRERVVCTADNIEYPAFVKKDEVGTYTTIDGREKPLTYFLNEIFRKTSLRSGQLPIISHILADKTTIGLLPTGGGKSLTYQLSCMLQPGVTIIVDPLVSLMVDQVRGLHDIRIDACECVNSTMNADDKAKKLNALQNGNVLFMLLSPERFMMQNFRESLLNMTEHNHIYFSYGVIDEVHCVSEWGHDFRTSYLHLGRNMINFMHTSSSRPLSVVGLTATASFDVLADVERELTLGGQLAIDSETIVRPENKEREELTYRIVEVKADFDKLRNPNEPCVLNADSEWALKDVVSEAKRHKLLDLLREVPNDLGRINSSDITSSCYIPDYAVDGFYAPDKDNKYQNAGIIFCPHKYGSFGVIEHENSAHSGTAKFLRAEMPDLQVGTFVGGDKPTGDMATFSQNDLSIMVATKAFGMGIDKPNIRFTVNLSHSSSIESFVQEAGRGGRDRKNAISYILFESTEFVHFTTDKINDIRYLMGSDDPTWLEYYRNKFVLWNDMKAFCESHGLSSQLSDKFLSIIEQKKYIENVDKDIMLWFHNNSFKGLFKEVVILQEMTNHILNVRPGRVVEIQSRLRDFTGNEDILLKINAKNNSMKIVSVEEPSKQYGFLYLDNLRPYYNYINFDYDVCRGIVEPLIELLSEYEDHSAVTLLRPINNPDNYERDIDGIYAALSQVGPDGFAYVTVSWENLIAQDPQEFDRNIRSEITRLAKQQAWSDILPQNSDKFHAYKIDSFDELLERISYCSNDTNWLRYHNDRDLYRPLRKLFCAKRDKNDTDKAIYRMCCIGLVEDVTIDYLSETYELKIVRRTDEQYREHMLSFFRKYYSQEQAEEKVAQIDLIDEDNYLDKCLVYLTKFVYGNLKAKRGRAIDDMRIACIDSINDRDLTNKDNWLKEFIHLYFNSKYARDGYAINGKPYSLTYDTDALGKSGFDIVEKYIDAMISDQSGSEVENVKHLYGATLLNLRAHPDNAALCLLHCYCIAFLGAKTNDALNRNALNGYLDGFMAIYHQNESELWSNVDTFTRLIAQKVHPDDKLIRQNILEKGKISLMLLIHGGRFTSFTDEYTADEDEADKNDDDSEDEKDTDGPEVAEDNE